MTGPQQPWQPPPGEGYPAGPNSRGAGGDPYGGRYAGGPEVGGPYSGGPNVGDPYPGGSAGGAYTGGPDVGGPGYGSTGAAGGASSVGGSSAAPAPARAPHTPTTHPAGPYSDIGDVSVGELVGNVTRDLSTLMRQELALAQAEVKAEVSKAGKAAGALGGAGLAGYFAVLFLSISLWWALGHLIGNGWSALVVAVLWGIVGAVLYATGRKKLQEVSPTPERTVDTLKNVPDALKGERGATP